MSAKTDAPFGCLQTQNPKAHPNSNPSSNPNARTTEAQGSAVLEPTGLPPRAAAVGYLEVNPQFTCPTGARAGDIFRSVRNAVQRHVEEYQCFPDWSVGDLEG